jgi:hypothetical protein
MSTTAIALTGEEALKLIASDPEFGGMTVDDLRQAAKDIDALAHRKDRLVVSDARGRRGARSKAREREGEKLRIQAQVIRKAADEVEARKSATVGDAVKPRIVRALKRVAGRAA